jgi:hypothetical protein
VVPVRCPAGRVADRVAAGPGGAGAGCDVVVIGSDIGLTSSFVVAVPNLECGVVFLK